MINVERNTCRSQAFQFTPKVETRRRLGVIQRLLSEAVTNQQDFAFSRIPNAKGEHAPQQVQAIGSLFFIEVDQGFGVAVGGKVVPAPDQVLT